MEPLEKLLESDKIEDGAFKCKAPGWTVAVSMSPGLVGRIVYSYSPAFDDDFSLTAFLNMLASSTVFLHNQGWVAMCRVHQGASAEIHGARFRDSEKEGSSSADELFDLVMDALDLKALNAPVASTNTLATEFMRRHGFELSGVVPLSLSFNGVPANLNWYTRWRK